MQSFDYVGPYAYSITINTYGGRPFFVDDRFIRFCIGILQQEAGRSGFEVLAYCFMSNHVHLLLVGLTESSRLKPFMKAFKQIAGFAFKRETGASLWHRSYHERVLRREDDIHATAAYIWANPVRAGIVESAEDHTYSGPRDRLLGEAGRLSDKATLGGQTLRFVRTNSSAPQA